MPTFSATDQRTITIRAPRDQVAQALGNPARVREHLADELDSGELVDPTTIHYVRKLVEEKGVRFRGDYVVRYAIGDAGVTWASIGDGANMRSRGEAKLFAVGDGTTRVEFTQSIECDMEVNRLLAVVLRPIVEHKLKASIGGFLTKVKASLER